MTDETTESVLRWTQVVVPPNTWTKAMITGDPATDDWAGIEVIEVFHTDGGDIAFEVADDMTSRPIESLTGGWRARKTPYVDWINRQHAERAAAEQADPLEAHLLNQIGATDEITQRNVAQGYIELQDDGAGKHRVVLTEKGAARARELLGLPADFPLNEV